MTPPITCLKRHVVGGFTMKRHIVREGLVLAHGLYLWPQALLDTPALDLIRSSMSYGLAVGTFSSLNRVVR